MDDDLARILATGATTALRELERLYLIAKHHVPENVPLHSGIADALTSVGLHVLQPAFDACPDLEAEFKRRVERYGAST